MEQLTLTSDLFTGIADIDQQHRKLFSLANRLLAPKGASSDRLSVLQALAFLGGYVDYHFASEELAMRDSDFPHYKEHCTFHESFREQVGHIAEEVRNNASTDLIMRRVASLVVDWLLTHIRIMDRELAEYLASHADKNSVHLPGPDRLKEQGLIPVDYVVPESIKVEANSE